MAGAGHKLWSAGDVVAASGSTDINTALLQQIVGVYAASANRDAAFGGAGEPALSEGMVCYLNDTNEFQVYTGSAWVTIGDPDVMVVDSANARVGIGTGAPDSLVHARLNEVTGAQTPISGDLVQLVVENSLDAGMQFLSASGQQCRIYFGDKYDKDVGSIVYDHNADSLIFTTATATAMTIDNSTNVDIVGALSKGSGTFDIVHPIKGGDWRLRHSFIEGPQADLIYRGTVTLAGGTATVDLDTVSNMTPGTWEALCRDPWTMAASSGNAVEWVLDGSTLTITGPADAVCSWMVIAERQDDHIRDDSPIADADGHLIVEYERVEPTPEAEPAE